MTSKADRIDVSIIVVAWNVGPYIAEAVESCLKQSLGSIEIIVIENGSTDDTAAEIDRVAAGDPRVVVLRNDSNRGLGPARNQGMDAARGRYIAFLDGDDWLEPHAMERAYGAALEHDADVVLFGHDRARASGVRRRDCNFEWLAGGLCATIDERAHAIRCFGVVWNKIYRRSFIEREGFRFTNSYFEDIDWTFPIFMVAPRLATLRESLITYRLRDGSILRQFTKRHYEVFDRWRSVIDFIDRNETRIDPRWKKIIGSSMARQLDSMIKSPFAGGYADRLAFARHIAPLVRHLDPKCHLKFKLLRRMRYKALWHGKSEFAVALMIPDIIKRRLEK